MFYAQTDLNTSDVHLHFNLKYITLAAVTSSLSIKDSDLSFPYPGVWKADLTSKILKLTFHVKF